MSTQPVCPIPDCPGHGVLDYGRLGEHEDISCDNPACELHHVPVLVCTWKRMLEALNTPRLPACKANKNHRALHLVAEKWARLTELAMGEDAEEVIPTMCFLMAETCRAIASTTCEFYAPGPAGSDGHTTCSGRGLPECATCNALEPADPLQVNPWPRPRPTKEPKP